MKIAAVVWILLAASTAARAQEVTPLSAGLRQENNLWVLSQDRHQSAPPLPSRKAQLD